MQKSYHDIKITYHGNWRMFGRADLSSKQARQKLAHKARYNGQTLTGSDCKINHLSLNLRSERLYKFYNGFIFVFVGKGRRTLCTIIKGEIE